MLPTLNRPAHNRPDRRQQFVDQSPICHITPLLALTSRLFWSQSVKNTSGEKFCAPARHSPYKAEYQISNLQLKQFCRYVQWYAENCRGHVTYATPTFRENYLCARSAFQIQSCIPNLKSLAQVVFEILRSKHIGVTSLTFQSHATSSVT